VKNELSIRDLERITSMELWRQIRDSKETAGIEEIKGTSVENIAEASMRKAAKRASP
jgi:hypothetical protein